MKTTQRVSVYTTPSRKKKAKIPWKEWLQIALVALILAVLLRLFVLQSYRVNSGSMEDILLEGDFIFVDLLVYESSEPKIGDVIVFKYPNDPDRLFTKRIVALPGQEVRISSKLLFVDGIGIFDSWSKYVYQDTLSVDDSRRDNFESYIVPPNSYFVMGDNRDDSRDSRFWGAVPRENIKGRAWFVYWSWEPHPDPPGWEFPYVYNIVEWIGHALYNFPTHVRWIRIGNNLHL